VTCEPVQPLVSQLLGVASRVTWVSIFPYENSPYTRSVGIPTPLGSHRRAGVLGGGGGPLRGPRLKESRSPHLMLEPRSRPVLRSPRDTHGLGGVYRMNTHTLPIYIRHSCSLSLSVCVCARARACGVFVCATCNVLAPPTMPLAFTCRGDAAAH
jgi:hypothetical protein